ncbi:DUF4253 domain-containing protein [Antribacter gilvus]|uniref:DUF4253 domain-containing protein n=1 Tax=Antribacter gilvus TaxID=2304675 RepID=UPI000F7A6284|nr:DUF4253 domain-containing protein [Antribacter gilvus]
MDIDRDLPEREPMMTFADGRVLEGFGVARDEAHSWWKRLSDASSTSGLVPIVTDAESIRAFTERPDQSRTSEENLAVSLRLDVAAQLAADFENALRSREWVRDDVVAYVDGAEPWPEITPRDEGVELLATVPSAPVVLLLEASSSWQAPCVIGYTGWEAFPRPSKHSATLRYFEQRYGARVFTMAGDSVGLSVARPPLSRYEALQTAHEFRVYSEHDIYGDRLTETAAGLLGNRFWRAYWD